MPQVHKKIAVLSALAAWLCLAPVSAAREGDAQATQLLSKVRAALGGEESLAKVRALSFDLTSGGSTGAPFVTGHALALPDKYQQTTPTLAFTLSGKEYWSSTGDTSAAETVRRQMVRWMIVLLVPKPESLGLTLTVRQGVAVPDGAETADVLSYAGPEQFSVDLFIDHATNRPLGYTWPFWSQRPQPGFFARFANYHPTQGIQFPGLINSQVALGQAKPSITQATVTNVQVNPDMGTRFVRK